MLTWLIMMKLKQQLYLASWVTFSCWIKKYPSILYCPVHISDHWTHIPCTVWFPILRIFLRTDIFLDSYVPSILMSFINAKIDIIRFITDCKLYNSPSYPNFHYLNILISKCFIIRKKYLPQTLSHVNFYFSKILIF